MADEVSIAVLALLRTSDPPEDGLSEDGGGAVGAGAHRSGGGAGHMSTAHPSCAPLSPFAPMW